MDFSEKDSIKIAITNFIKANAIYCVDKAQRKIDILCEDPEEDPAVIKAAMKKLNEAIELEQNARKGKSGSGKYSLRTISLIILLIISITHIVTLLCSLYTMKKSTIDGKK